MAEVELVKKELEVGKELSEAVEAVVHILDEALDKKSVAEIAASSLGKLMTAVEGADQMDDEIKHVTVYDTALWAGLQVLAVLLKDRSEPPEAA